MINNGYLLMKFNIFYMHDRFHF